MEQQAETALTRPRRLERMLAGAMLLTLFVKVPGLSLFPILSAGFAVALLPVTVGQLKKSAILRVLYGACLLALASGLALSLWVPRHLGVPGDPGTVATVLGWLVVIPLIVSLGVWAASFFTFRTALLLVTIGGLFGAAASEGTGWKSSFGIYETLLVLALVSRMPVAVTRLVLIGSAVLSAVLDARSMAVISLLVLVSTFVTPSVRARFTTRPFRSTVVALIGLSAALDAALWAMRAGVLGAAIQARTLEQMQGGRSVLATGRQEWSATLQLFAHNPLGYGVATQVDGGIASAGDSAVKAAGGDYTASYFRVFVFGPRTDLHSMLADLWYHFGFGGVVFAGACALVLVLGLTKAFGQQAGLSALLVYAILGAAWDLLFSPMGNSDRLMVGMLAALAVGLAQNPAGKPGAADGDDRTDGVGQEFLGHKAGSRQSRVLAGEE